MTRRVTVALVVVTGRPDTVQVDVPSTGLVTTVTKVGLHINVMHHKTLLTNKQSNDMKGL